MAIVTLTTDFGVEDAYVGEMKGALLAIHSGAVIVDLTHAIGPGNVRQGAWIIAQAWPAFPAGTIHVVVVDPGVGSERRALAVQNRGHIFVAPDNGLLHLIIDPGEGEVRAIGVGHRALAPRGTTFDGRDLFAPVAARLAEGMSFSEVGPEIRDPIRLAPFQPIREDGVWRAEVIRADRFGNLVTTARASFLQAMFGERWREIRVAAGGREIELLRESYVSVPPGGLVLTMGSAGTLELSCNGGRARDVLGVGPGDWIEIHAPRARASG